MAQRRANGIVEGSGAGCPTWWILEGSCTGWSTHRLPWKALVQDVSARKASPDCQMVRLPSAACCVGVGGTTATPTRAILYVMKPSTPVSTCRICAGHAARLSDPSRSGSAPQGECQHLPGLAQAQAVQ